MSDSLDNLIHGAFARFDAEERGSYEPVPGAAAVRGTVTRRRHIRYALLSLLLVALIAVPVSLVTTAGHGKSGQPPVGTPTEPVATSAAPSPSTSPAPQAGPLTVADPLNGTITMPAFPGYTDECQPAGPRTFVNGVYQNEYGVGWTIGALKPIEANLDGEPGNELLTSVSCDTDGSVHVTQLIALRVGAGGVLSVLGYVINSPDVPNLSFYMDQVTVSGGVVVVTASGPESGEGSSPCYHQVRGFAYRSGKFTQVSGPTKFPPLPSDIRSVDWPDAGLQITIGGPSYVGDELYCVVLNRGSGVAETYPGNDGANAPVQTTFTLGPVSYVTDTSQGAVVAVGLVTHQEKGKPAEESVQTFSLQDGSLDGAPVVVTGDNGVTRIQSATGSGKQIAVTLTVGGKRETWIYTMSADGVWTHAL